MVRRGQVKRGGNGKPATRQGQLLHSWTLTESTAAFLVGVVIVVVFVVAMTVVVAAVVVAMVVAFVAVLMAMVVAFVIVAVVFLPMVVVAIVVTIGVPIVVPVDVVVAVFSIGIRVWLRGFLSGGVRAACSHATLNRRWRCQLVSHHQSPVRHEVCGRNTQASKGVKQARASSEQGPTWARDHTARVHWQSMAGRVCWRGVGVGVGVGVDVELSVRVGGHGHARAHGGNAGG